MVRYALFPVGFCTSAKWKGGDAPASMAEEQVVGRDLVQTLSFIARVIPSRKPEPSALALVARVHSHLLFPNLGVSSTTGLPLQCLDAAFQRSAQCTSFIYEFGQMCSILLCDRTVGVVQCP